MAQALLKNKMAAFVIPFAISGLTACGEAGEASPQTAPQATEVTDAASAQNEAAKRRAEDLSSSGEIEQLSWEYGPCTDAASLIPPPLEGWGLLNDTPLGEWPIGPDNARITYSFVDETLDPNSAEYGQSRQNVSIYISSDAAQVEGLQTFLSNPQLRDGMFEAGPFNYPVQKHAMGTLLGTFIVQGDGHGDDVGEYFETIIKCGIESGLIAEGIAPDSLTLR